MNSTTRPVAALLLVSALLLAILVPGGPIETRQFSHISPWILGSFNIFLTVLGLGSLLLIVFVLKQHAWAKKLAAASGLGYLAVYLLDLGGIFPVSPDAMPEALLVIEVVGSAVSLPLIYLSLRAQPKPSDEWVETEGSGLPLIVLVLAVVAGIGVITFATMSAMGY